MKEFLKYTTVLFFATVLMLKVEAVEDNTLLEFKNYFKNYLDEIFELEEGQENPVILEIIDDSKLQLEHDDYIYIFKYDNGILSFPTSEDDHASLDKITFI